MSYEILTEDYIKRQSESEKLKEEVDSLSSTKAELSNEVQLLSAELEELDKRKRKLESEVGILTDRVRGLESNIREANQEKSVLQRETKELKRQRTQLSSQVDAKAEVIGKLRDIGLGEEDLLRLKAFLERRGRRNKASFDQVREDLFSMMALYRDISGLERKRGMNAGEIKALVKERSVLTGEIKELEEQKGILLGEIDRSVTSTLQKLKDYREEAAAQLQQQINSIRDQFNSVVVDAVKTGEAVSRMKQMAKEGENAGKSLTDFWAEAKNRLAGGSL